MAEPGQSLSRNRVMDKIAMKQSISGLTIHSGTVYTAHIPDQLKTLGFQQATHAAASSGIDDLITTPSKERLVQDAESQDWFEEQHHCYGNAHVAERSRRSIEVRYTMSEHTKTEMNPNLGTTDPLNPAHVMPLPGARGNISQTHQLLGMRGSMSNPKGQTTDLPTRSNPREGSSSAEYMTPRYGARKGIADTAVRTADAGYPTRRPVEVVQRVVARTVDRGTIRGVTVSPVLDRQSRQMIIARSRPIGCVSADNVYVDTRRIAARDQDTGAELADQSVSFQKRPISIRPPSARKSMFWICRSRHGRSLAHGDPVELGEAVGTTAGQPIGEPGTQSTLRTFHTGGIPTGDIAQHTRTPSTGTVMSNAANSVHHTRTPHGHPAWVCDDDSSVAIGNEYEACHLTIPSQSSITVRNGQHVEANQVLAEIHAEKPITRDKVRKYIYSSMYGEMHLGTRVPCRNSEHCIYSSIHISPETSYVRVSSGAAPCAGGTRSIFHGGGDKIDAQSLPAGKDQSTPDSLYTGNPNTNPRYYRSDGAAAYELTTFDRRCDRGAPGNRDEDLIPLSLTRSYRVVTRGHERGGVHCLSEQRRWKCGGNGMIPRSEPFQQDVATDSAANRSGYATTEPEMIEFRATIVGSAGGRTGGMGAERPVARRHHVATEQQGGHFRSVSEDARRITHEPTCPVPRADVAQAGAQTIPSGRWSTEGAGAQSTREGSMIRISSGGNVIRVTESDGASETEDTSVPPKEITYGASESVDWNHYWRRVALYTDKAFASLGRKRRRGGRRLTMEDHEIRSKSGVFEFPNWDLLEGGQRGTPKWVRAAVSCPRGEDGVGVVGDTWTRPRRSAQPRRPRILDRQKQDLAEEADTPSVEVTTSALLARYHASINRDSVGHSLMSDYGCNAGAGFQYISDARVCRPAVHSTGDNNLVLSQHGGIPRVPHDRYRKRTTSLPILSSPGNACQIPLSPALARMAGGKKKPDGSDDAAIPSTANPLRDSRAFIRPHRREDKRSTRLDSEMTANAFLASPLYDSTRRVAPPETLALGLPGNNLHGMGRPAAPTHRLTRHRCLTCEVLSEDSTISKLFKTSSVLSKWFLRGEDRAYSQLLIMRERARTPARLYPSSPTQCLLPSPSCATLRSVSLGRSIREGVSVRGSGGLTSRSCQVKAINVEFAVIGLAEPYSANERATVHGSSGGTIGEGDALVTLISERSRFEDTISQGPPKIEQFSEPRPDTSVSTDLKDSFRDRSSGGMAWIFGRAPGYLSGARTSLERSRVNPVDRTEREYRSQGVQIADKHAEMIARQVTPKTVAPEDGMANASPPGEPTEVSRAWRMDCAPEAKITCRPVLLGVTRAPLNTKSLTPGASSQETTRVLAGAATRGQTDRLKGSKENAIVGRTVPAGTGCGGALRKVIPLDELEEISGTGGNPFHSAEDLSSNSAEFILRLPPSGRTIRRVSASVCYGAHTAEKRP
uniref:DNA-directed RNA polymerase n=1 Tax=Selaginella hainanensis TaxID=2547368 RepID=A0A482CFS6_9TRAC|nr:RNA polymerase beta'' subunit [Selaginella hainanensis]QBL76090.1 RNA polymerase beta'' subunit [Selaginella hainanensis]